MSAALGKRGVFDLTNRDSKTLQLALLLAASCHCTVARKSLRDSPAALLCGKACVVTELWRENLSNHTFYLNANLKNASNPCNTPHLQSAPASVKLSL